MKKKIISICLIACMVLATLSVFGCAEVTTAVLVADAVNKTEALESYEGEMKMEIEMEIEGETFTIPMTAIVKIQNAKSEKPLTYTSMDMEYLGYEMKFDMYSDGEWCYLIMDGEKYKMSMEDASDSDYDYTADVNSMLKTLPEDILEDLEATENEDGSRTVTVSLSQETFKEIYADYIEEITKSYTAESVEELNFSDISITITVKDGYVHSYDIDFSMTMTMYGITVPAKVSSELTYKNPGEQVTVTLPDGYENFEKLMN